MIITSFDMARKKQ